MSAPGSSAFKIKQHDLETPLRIRLTDTDPDDPTEQRQIPVDLTAAVKVTVIGQHQADLNSHFEHEVTGSGADGVVVMPWSVGDTDVAGVIDVEVQVDWPGTPPRPQTFPNGSSKLNPSGYMTVIIQEDLGGND